MPRHPPNAQKSTNSTQHTTTNLTSDTGARTALGPAQPTLCRAAHTRPPTPTPPTNGEDKRGPQGGGEPKQQKTFLMLASTMQFTTNPPETPQPRHTPPKPAPGRTRGAESEGDRPEGGPRTQGAPPQNPTACHAPAPPPASPPAQGGGGRNQAAQESEEQKRCEGGEGAAPGGSPAARPATPCSRPNRFETP